jgi:hypothetical protein
VSRDRKSDRRGHFEAADLGGDMGGDFGGDLGGDSGGAQTGQSRRC